MLESQNRGRHEHCHLLAVACRLESGAHCHLGLAETYISAHQTVHGTRTLHVCLYLLRRLYLVGSVLIQETCLKLMLHERVRTERKAFLMTAFGIELYQIARYVFYAFLGTFFQTFPRSGAEGAQAWRVSGSVATVF